MQTAAAVAAQALLHSGDARWYKTKQAPGPDDVNWSALWCSSDERLGRRMLSGLVYFVIMLIPLGAFAGVLSVVRAHPGSPAAACFTPDQRTHACQIIKTMHDCPVVESLCSR